MNKTNEEGLATRDYRLTQRKHDGYRHVRQKYGRLTANSPLALVLAVSIPPQSYPVTQQALQRNRTRARRTNHQHIDGSASRPAHGYISRLIRHEAKHSGKIKCLYSWYLHVRTLETRPHVPLVLHRHVTTSQLARSIAMR